jgi:diaminopimelate epimerase
MNAFGSPMLAPFLKMHGCGNDFVVFDERDGPLGITPALATALADRRTGIGCDQLITIERAPRGSGAAAFMRIRNPDGSEAGACGNATRCVAGLIAREGRKRKLAIATVSGKLTANLGPDGEVEVDMGPARFGWEDVPLARPMDTLHLDLAAAPHPDPLPQEEREKKSPLPLREGVGGGVSDPAALSMGNPHATFFVPDLAAIPIETLGPALEHDSLFPERANIGFAQVLAPDHIRLRVWERGAGLTRACGSGACAALVNAHRRGLTDRRAAVELDGGVLEIEWREKDGHVLMSGPTATVFTGVIDLSGFPA